jgi:DNA topoisomerase IB
VNEYLREITQQDFTAKDFRTWHGTGHMAQQLAALGPPVRSARSSRTSFKRLRRPHSIHGKSRFFES